MKFEIGMVPWNKGLSAKEDVRVENIIKKLHNYNEENNYECNKWRKGLTKDTDSRIRNISKALKKSYENNSDIKCGFKKGNTYYKSVIKINPKRFKKGMIPWNYVDGRGKFKRHSIYGEDWEEIKHIVHLRDNFSCQHCSTIKKRLDVHHKIPFRYTQDNSLDNLISLCRKCHMKEEHKISKELKIINGGVNFGN